MHRVHHSVEMRETNSNFGFNLPWWDRLFGTYRAEPAAGHEGMTIGVRELRDPAGLRLDRMLLQPLRRDDPDTSRSEEHTSELQSLMRISYAVFCLKKKQQKTPNTTNLTTPTTHSQHMKAITIPSTQTSTHTTVHTTTHIY